jgi:WD40 repeat protein
MSGERIDYAIERQRHEGFIGRTAQLAELDELLLANRSDCWVLVSGGPGMGKSALVAAWLARRELAGVTIPHHFIRRGEYDWDNPAKLVGSLVGQIEERFPDLRESKDDVQNHPATRLVAILNRVSAKELVPNRERLVILIDGLDAYDPPAGAPTADPLAAFLPHALPHGVSFLCTSRPRHPHVEMLASRDGELQRIDLDDPAVAADNDATVRELWDRAAPALGLDKPFIDEVVARAGGNPQHAVTLRKHLASLPAAQRRVENIPRGLSALLAGSWQRVAGDPLVVRGLGILCAAREALTLDDLAAVAGWTDEAQRQAFLRGASEFLIETRRAVHQAEYRLHHDAIVEHVSATLGAAVLRGHHAALARQLASWPAPTEASARRYALRYALSHRAQAGDGTWAWRLATDLGFWQAKCSDLGVHEAEADAARAAGRCRASGATLRARQFDDLAHALMRESHRIRAAPDATAALVWNRLRRSGWSTEELDGELRVPAGAAFLRVRYAVTRESPALVRDLVGHSMLVTACAVTPDCRRVVSASADKTLKIWDLESGRVLATLAGHDAAVTACAITPDGRRVVSASGDRTLKVWEIDTGRMLATLAGHGERVTTCAVTLDGRRVISGSADRTLGVWDLGTTRLIGMLDGHTDRVTACAIAPDGQRVLSASWDRTLKVWDLATERAIVTLEGHTAEVTACSITPDGRRAISASKHEPLRVWDLETGSTVALLEGHADRINACAVTRDGQRLVTASNDQTIKVWELATGRVLATFEGHGWWVTACAVTPDGRRAISASWDKTLKVWNLDRGHVPTGFEGHGDGVTACAVTSDGQRVVTASRDHTLKVWAPETGRVLATLEDHAGPVIACTVTRDGQLVISASQDQTFKVWEMERGRILATFERHAEGVTACAVTPDGRRVVSASGERTVKVWDLDSGDLVSMLVRHTEGVTACAVTPDGARVVSASGYQSFLVWDLDTGRVLTAFGGHAGRVTACAIMPGGDAMVSASEDRTLKIWDLSSGRVLASLEGHTGRVNSCAVTPDGRHVVSASEDGTLRVWDLDSHVCRLVHHGDVAYTAVAAHSTAIVAGDSAGTVWFLDWPTPSVRRSAPTLLPDPVARAGAGRALIRPVAEPARPTAQRHVILFLAANPRGTTGLDLDDECAAIERELSMVTARHEFDFHSKWAVSIDAMMRHLNELQPAVIHFSGHGEGDPATSRDDHHRARRRDIAETTAGAAIYLEDEREQRRQVGGRPLAQMIASAAPRARVVVLNACYSDALAEALLGVVECVVGMRGAISDGAAPAFAVAFYRALGNRRSIGNAVDQARATLAARQLPDEQLPMCRTRDGVNAHELFLPSVDVRGS